VKTLDLVSFGFQCVGNSRLHNLFMRKKDICAL
jgi:hypothetical protein